MSQPPITVAFVGNRSMECTCDEIDSNSGATPAADSPATDSPLSDPPTEEPESQTSCGAAPSSPEAEEIPKTDHELHQLFANTVLQRLQTYAYDSDDSQASYDETPSSKKRRRAVNAVNGSEKVRRLLVLHATLLDGDVTYKKLKLRSHYKSKWTLDTDIEDDIVAAGNKITGILDVWRNIGVTSTTAQGGRTSPSDQTTPQGDQTTPQGDQTTPQGDPIAGPSTPKRKSASGRQPLTPPLKNKRSKHDKSAQETVPKWYGKRCLATHKRMVDGAHIFPVNVRNQPLDHFWVALNVFWPEEKVLAWKEAVHKAETEFQNVLPLSPEAHRRWDHHYFSLRPIKHERDPEHILYVQICWSNPIDKATGQRADNVHDRDYIDIRGEQGVGGLCDWREVGDCNGKPHIRAIRSGDIYRITTSDPAKYPLPSAELLEIQYALHRVLGSMKAAGWIKHIFRGNPPDVDPVPRGWQFLKDSALAYLLEEAEDQEVLTTEAADKWRGALLLAEYAEREKEANFSESLGWDTLALPPLSDLLPAAVPGPSGRREAGSEGEEGGDGTAKEVTAERDNGPMG